MLALLILMSAVGLGLGQTGCMVADVCSSDTYQPECTTIENNIDGFCALLGGENAFGTNCTLTSGCNFSSGINGAGLLFCCPFFSVSPRVSSSAVSTYSPRQTPVTSYSSSVTRSPIATTSCLYHAYSAAGDFSSSQGNKGWYYGYYNGATFTQFTSYGISTTGSVGSVNSWNYNINSNGIISSSMIMQNGANSCNTPTYGNIAPVLRWFNPIGSCYQDVTISLSLSGNVNSAGSIVSLTVNGVSLFSFSGDLNIDKAFNVYGVRSVELSVGPLASNCDYGQTSYTLTIYPMGSSATVASSKTYTASMLASVSAIRSRSISASPSHSGSNARSISASNSVRSTASESVDPSVSRSGLASRSASLSSSVSKSSVVSLTSSHSATATSTVFYTGVWTPFVGYNYANGDIAQIGSFTLNQCKLRCWLNPLCGLIVVTSPCNTMDLNSTDPDTLVCGQCWLKQTSGWSISSDDVSSSFMLYDRVYPPTGSSVASVSVSASPRVSSSLTTVFNNNMCSGGGTVTLPVLGSSVNVITNAVGSQYGNNAGCSLIIKGGSTVAAEGAMQFLVTFSAFATEDCCDHLTIVSKGVTVFTYRGSVVPSPIYIPYSNQIQLIFGSDGSVTSSGVVLNVALVEGPSPSLTSTVSRSPPFSASSSFSATGTRSVAVSRSPSVSSSLSSSARGSQSVTANAYRPETPTGSHTQVKSQSGVSSFLSSSTGSCTLQSSYSSRRSLMATATPWDPEFGTATSVFSESVLPSPSFDSQSNSYSISSSASPGFSLSPSMSYSQSPSPSYSPLSMHTPINSYSVTPLFTAAFTSSGTVTPSLSSSIRVTVTPFNTVSYYNSGSGNRTFSSTATFSRSMTLSKTASASYYYRPKLTTPPGLPANLDSLNSEQISDAITNLGNYDPSLIKDNLQILGAAALFKMDGPLIIETDTFALAMAKLSTGNTTEPLVAGSLAVTVPQLNISGAAASSIINWAKSPYPNTTTDSPVISMTIINTGGGELIVKNLSEPIRMDWKLTIDPDDPRFAAPPTYLARCDNKVVYKGVGDELSLYNGPKYVVSGYTHWLVPCLMGTNAWINCSYGDTVKNFACPSAQIINRCLYWSKTLGAWSEDGCKAISGGNDTMTCMCDHLTDFSARLDAVVSENTAIFANAANVYSLEGLIKYMGWYSIFGGIGLMTFLLGLFVIRVDQIAIGKYVQALCENENIAEMLHFAARSPVYIYDAFSTLNEVERRKSTRKVVPLNLIQRILVQHSRLGFLFRYDPRLSRVFRLLSIFLMQFHSLFVTALFYGFTYGASGKGNMMWYDTILLAFLTTALNIPVVKLLVSSMNTVGLEEFKVMFPVLFAEYTRRVEFEKLGIAYLAKRRGLLLNIVDDGEKSTDDSPSSRNSDSSSSSGFNLASSGGDDEEDGILDIILMYFCCRNKKDEKKEDYNDETVHHLLRRLAEVVKESYPYIEPYANFWGMFPCHTRSGFFFLVVSFGWIIWCLNYLLLFAASHQQSVGESVMISYATSEITTVFLTQPLIILVSYFFYKFLVLYKDKIPVWLQKRLMPNKVRSIPAVYYFSDPWVGKTMTSFTSEYAYNLFVRCPAAASGVSEQVYANQKAISYEELPKDNKLIVELKALYKKLVGTWDDIKNNR